MNIIYLYPTSDSYRWNWSLVLFPSKAFELSLLPAQTVMLLKVGASTVTAATFGSFHIEDPPSSNSIQKRSFASEASNFE